MVCITLGRLTKWPWTVSCILDMCMWIAKAELCIRHDGHGTASALMPRPPPPPLKAAGKFYWRQV